jgi:AraC family ethanolamine operon transcriptional activator
MRGDMGGYLLTPILQTGIFTDNDEFAESAAGLNIEFNQLDCGKLHARLDLAIGQKFVVQHFDIGRRVHQRGAIPDELLTFGLPDNFAKLNWYGRPMPRESILNFSRRDGFDAVSDADFTGFTFSIPSAIWQNSVSALDASLSAERVRGMADNFTASSDDIRRMRTLAHGIHQCLRYKVVAQNAYCELEADLAHMLAKCVSDSSAADASPGFAQRQLAVNKALDLIFSTHDAITVSDVYAYSAVSWRTLDRAFRERFGITPKQYIVARRLAGARRALVAARPGTTVTGIANDWGFWHLGRFSADYNRMFRELPSTTLASI